MRYQGAFWSPMHTCVYTHKFLKKVHILLEKWLMSLRVIIALPEANTYNYSPKRSNNLWPTLSCIHVVYVNSYRLTHMHINKQKIFKLSKSGAGEI